MNPRLGHSYMTNSIAIRQEIQRFESVHPSIYAIYDLIEAIPDLLIQQQIREHVVCIEDSFVNSQEWTLSRSVPDLKLGILGTVNSGKSALVHRYLTGSYLQEESPEGGRFKKEVLIDGQSYLLLIRDEGGLPELQFTQWVDAVIFVFSLENELSFNAIYSFFAKMSHHHTNVMHDIPIILVGTQDAISESNPRLIDDARARKLAGDLKKCAYYETCATYGLNVERVFQDACQKIILARHQHPDFTPSTSILGSRAPLQHHALPHHQLKQGYETHSYSSSGSGGAPLTPTAALAAPHHGAPSPPFQEAARESNKDRKYKDHQRDDRRYRLQEYGDSISAGTNVDGQEVDVWDQTPLIAPNSSRKLSNSSFSNNITSTHDSSNDRIEQKFPKIEEETRNRLKNMELGIGRVIPVKQGILYKKSNKALNKDWKKKYFTLLDDGRLTYHPTLHDYMENVKGKEINLLRTTVKIPGQRPKGSEKPANGQTNNSTSETNKESLSETNPLLDQPLPAFLSNLDPSHPLIMAYTQGDQGMVGTPIAKTPSAEIQNKKKPKKSKSSQDDGESCDFMVVSLDNTVWHLEAQSAEERDDWVSAIEQQILACLQLNFSDKSRNNVSNSVTDRNIIQRIRMMKGNMKCADCDMQNPDWASVNLGILVCIECSGIHRNLGTHLSRIRSLDLDEWPPNLVLVMTSIGNRLANSIWEGSCSSKLKPESSASREEKERWIRSKYENKEFLPNPPYVDVALPQQLIDAIARQDVHNTILVLAYCTPELVNTPYSNTDTRRALHIAAALGNQVLVQLLLWHGANVRLLDHEGYNPLFYARSAGNSVCADLLRTQGSPDVPTLPRRRISNPSNNSTPPNNGSAGSFEKLPTSVL